MKTASTALPILTNILPKVEGRCLLVPDLKMFSPDKINKYCVSVLVFISYKRGDLTGLAEFCTDKWIILEIMNQLLVKLKTVKHK